MARNTQVVERGNKLALQVFNEAMQLCDSEDEIFGLATMLCTLSAKLMHGLEGKQFKKDFMRSAIADNEKITLHRVN